MNSLRVVRQMTKRNVRVLRLHDGAAAAIRWGDEAARVLGSRSDSFAELIAIEVDATYEAPDAASGEWFFARSREDEFAWTWADARSLVAQERFVLAEVAGRIVAIAAYKAGGVLPDGRAVYEITKAVTAPEWRGRGLYRALRAHLLRIIRERHPLAPILSFTKHPSVVRRCEEMGWRALSLEEYSQVTERSGRTGLSPDAIAGLRHWKAFLFDPLA